ncbi:MAG: hypothetical protein DDT32_02091 [Syntrophomonadaceae bacterium]|nr:hypothetical protein [Bacillota bacterium]MBT9148319.1 hypothetical protein [Bacillota bacterium]
METDKSNTNSVLHKGEQILNLNWSTWYPLTEENIKCEVPEIFGIYKVRRAGGMLIPRLVGKSEILYMGRSGTSMNRTLRHRLLELVRHGHSASRRVEQLQKELDFSLEFCYAETQEPEAAEKLLLMLYGKEHYELPPLNQVGGL